MKTSLIAVLTGIALVSFTGLSHAQYAATGPDGITASPKLRQFLDDHKTVAGPTVKAMSCAKCKNVIITRTDWTARGAIKTTESVAKHLCPGCKTKVTTTGYGKAAQSISFHTCTQAGDAQTASCCGTGS